VLIIGLFLSYYINYTCNYKILFSKSVVNIDILLFICAINYILLYNYKWLRYITYKLEIFTFFVT